MLLEDYLVMFGVFNVYVFVEVFYKICDVFVVVGLCLCGNEMLKYKFVLL